LENVSSVFLILLYLLLGEGSSPFVIPGLSKTGLSSSAGSVVHRKGPVRAKELDLKGFLIK